MARFRQTTIFALFLMLASAYIFIYIGVKTPTLNSAYRLNTTNCSSMSSQRGCLFSAFDGDTEKRYVPYSFTKEPAVVTMRVENSSIGERQRTASLGHGIKVPLTVKKKTKEGPHGVAPPLPSHSMKNGNETVYVLWLAYQRSGSTFTGNLLNRNPAVFYVYEPLDALYSSLYGIRPGWSVPSDITGNKDGSLRNIPDYEIKAATDVISNLLECNFDNLPKEVLLSQFWLQFWSNQVNILDFTKCMAQSKVHVATCHSLYLRRTCSMRLGISRPREDRCFHFLHSQSQSNNGNIVKYTQCLLSQIDRAKACFPMLKERCEHSPIRGVKTVRATMQVAEQLLERHKNLKVVHLIRDPRPVLRSRMQHESFRGAASKKDMITEASYYCNVVYSNLQIRKVLEHKYGDRITDMIYEDFTNNPLEKAKEVYTFLQIPFAEEVRQWLVNNTANSAHIAHAWEKKIKLSDRIKIDKICKDVLHYWT